MKCVLVVMVLLAAACGDGGDPPEVRGVQCSVAYAEGAATARAIKASDEGCIDEDGTLLFSGSAFYECTDGRTLYWNDQGWGYSGDTWHRHARADGQKVPPDDETTGCNP